MINCSSQGCVRPAEVAMRLRDQPGHIHDCPGHAHDVREFCDVVESAEIEGDCPWPCTVAAIWTGVPTMLEDT